MMSDAEPDALIPFPQTHIVKEKHDSTAVFNVVYAHVCAHRHAHAHPQTK